MFLTRGYGAFNSPSSSCDLASEGLDLRVEGSIGILKAIPPGDYIWSDPSIDVGQGDATGEDMLNSSELLNDAYSSTVPHYLIEGFRFAGRQGTGCRDVLLQNIFSTRSELNKVDQPQYTWAPSKTKNVM